MCGILGAFNHPRFDVSRHLEQLAHRGPDGHGIVTHGAMTHGHVRLALLDLSAASDQPFRYRDAVLSFNGEIWNFRELRAELAARGISFTTTGDTEVLAAVLYHDGIAGLARVEGMFAFAWSHGDTNILVRDRYGKIPLYVHRWWGGPVIWSSERKGIPEYPMNALPPATVYDLTTGDMRPWYTLPATVPAPDLLALITAGVERRLIADAPLCCLISGGLDSTIILTIAQGFKADVVAYTASYDPHSADLKAARRVAAELGVTLIEVPLEEPTAEMFSRAARVIEISSKAQVEIAALCLPLAAAIASDGFKAVLSGEAADELFGGYGNMCIAGARADDAEWRAIRVKQVAKMARGNFIRCNKAFMAHGVECRLPFMDRALVESVLAMTKAECPPGKRALKNAVRGHIAQPIISRVKQTFQGGAGIDKAAARIIHNPRAFYHAEVTTVYGHRLHD